jgi:hypothetical protein
MTAENGVKPRKAVFIVMCILFILWMALLLLIYFKTVYPLRYPAQ